MLSLNNDEPLAGAAKDSTSKQPLISVSVSFLRFNLFHLGKSNGLTSADLYQAAFSCFTAQC